MTKTIKLNQEWVLCRSNCGRYNGYFKYNNIPSDYTKASDAIWISAKEFIDYLYLLDDNWNSSWQRTIEHFCKKHSPSLCQFEDVTFSKKEINNFVAACLIDDIGHITFHLGEEYTDWSCLDSLSSIRDYFFVENKNTYSVDDALAFYGLPSLEELENNHSTEDLSYKMKETDGESIYLFTLVV